MNKKKGFLPICSAASRGCCKMEIAEGKPKKKKGCCSMEIMKNRTIAAAVTRT